MEIVNNSMPALVLIDGEWIDVENIDLESDVE